MQEFVIRLNDLKYKAFHGLYPEERQNGNDFIVNIEIHYPSQTELIGDLKETIDYVAIAGLVTTIMQEPMDLLETVVQKIADAIMGKFSIVNRTVISIEKLHPPIQDFNGSVSVTLISEREI